VSVIPLFDGSHVFSNGTAGERWMANWCDRCMRNDRCTIVTQSYTGVVPAEWTATGTDDYECAAFEPVPSGAELLPRARAQHLIGRIKTVWRD
jgi:hypothetical protein